MQVAYCDMDYFKSCMSCWIIFRYKIILRDVASLYEEHVLETTKWLAKQQREDGSFVEDAIVIKHLVNHESW